MKTYNLIILAGGDKDAWSEQYGCSKKALLPLEGKPMLDRVVEAYNRSPYIDKIIVVGSNEIDELDSMRYVTKRVAEGGSFLENLLRAVFYLKTVVYKLSNNHKGYLISFCDAAFLDTQIINETLQNMAKHDPGLVLHYIKKDTIAQAGFPVENRTFLPIAGEPHTGSNLYYIKRIRSLLWVIKDVIALRKYRKDPKKFLGYLNCWGKGFPGIEVELSKRLHDTAKVFVSPYAQMGVDVDKPGDYELAQIYLAEHKKSLQGDEKIEPKDVEYPSQYDEVKR